LQQGARKQKELESGHERAIEFFWKNRKHWTGDFEDCRAELEAFYHHCELGQYDEAYRIMATCVQILKRQGYSAKLVPIYEQLTQQWQPDDEKEIRNLGAAWTLLGDAYDLLRRYKDAINCDQRALEIASETGNCYQQSVSLSNLGDAHDRLGQHQQAIHFLQQSLKISREIKDFSEEARSLCNLGNAYNSLGQYQLAIEYCHQSLVIACQVDSYTANPLIGLGNAHHSLGQYQLAIEYYHKSLETTRDADDRHREAISLSNLGNVYQSLGQYQRAIEFHQQSLDIKR